MRNITIFETIQNPPQKSIVQTQNNQKGINEEKPIETIQENNKEPNKEEKKREESFYTSMKYCPSE